MKTTQLTIATVLLLSASVFLSCEKNESFNSLTQEESSDIEEEIELLMLELENNKYGNGSHSTASTTSSVKKVGRSRLKHQGKPKKETYTSRPIAKFLDKKLYAGKKRLAWNTIKAANEYIRKCKVKWNGYVQYWDYNLCRRSQRHRYKDCMRVIHKNANNGKKYCRK